MKTNITGGLVWLDGLVDCDLQIANGKIVKIGRNLSNAQRTIDVKGKIILPGIIDSHVHFRDFKQKYKEDWRSGSMAAAAGGITTVLDMPNNDPPILTKFDLDKKRKLALKSLVNYGFHFGSSQDNLDQIEKN